jgi:hypothetical protein
MRANSVQRANLDALATVTRPVAVLPQALMTTMASTLSRPVAQPAAVLRVPAGLLLACPAPGSIYEPA